MVAIMTEDKRTAGELLRQGRLKQRFSIVECAKRTHIAQRFIEALEEEKWSELPSESHRLGFLRLYSRFLGVSADEVLALYHRKPPAPAEGSVSGAAPERRDPSAREKPSPASSGWSPSSIPQLITMAICTLLAAWLIYHAVTPHVAEQNPMPWSRRRAPTQARLTVPRAAILSQKVRLQAQANSWLRVTSRNQLLFEGILPANTIKEWSGAGPFQIKIGDVRALALYWNDQPFDLLAGAHGSMNDIRIPPQ
jgi:transcriptional regulator with XRE-family HTH domain